MAGKMQHLVPEKLLAHIGDITVSFALLEEQIRQVIWLLVSPEQRIGQIITAELSFKNLLSLVISLYKQRYGEGDDFHRLWKLVQSAEKLEVRRNTITHSFWGKGRNADTIIRLKTTARGKQGYKFQFQEVDETYLAEVAHDLKILAGDILDFEIKMAMDMDNSTSLSSE